MWPMTSRPRPIPGVVDARKLDQVAASRTRTTEAVWTRPNAARIVALTATLSEVKKTDASAGFSRIVLHQAL